MGAQNVRKQKCFGVYLLKQGRTHRLTNVKVFLKLFKPPAAISYDYTNVFRCTRYIFKLRIDYNL